MRQVRESYEPYKNLEEEAFNEVVFSTKPGAGACGTWQFSLGRYANKYLAVFEFE
jgi:hypothetical protein